MVESREGKKKGVKKKRVREMDKRRDEKRERGSWEKGYNVRISLRVIEIFNCVRESEKKKREDGECRRE